MARSVLGRGLKPLMDEAQVVTGIPTLSVDPKSVSRPETATVTPSQVTAPVTKTESRSTTSTSSPVGPSIYRRKSHTLPVGHSGRSLPRWPFWAADACLLSGALAVWLLAPRPMSLGSILFAALLIVVGAVLALVPWLTASGPRNPSSQAPVDKSADAAPPLQRLPFRLQ